MPAYKYQTKEGKTLWYCSFHYVDWTGAPKRKCKRGFITRKEALEWERAFLDRGAKSPDITFASLIKNYMVDSEARLKPTTLQTKSYVIETKLVPYFGKLKIKDIDPIRIRQWQNELMDYRDEDGIPYSETYLRTIHAQMSAVMNYAVRYYGLPKNPCHISGTIGKGKAGKMNIWTKAQFDIFISLEKKAAYHLAFDILYYTGMREGELLALTPADIKSDPPTISVNKNYAVVDGRMMFLTPKTDAGRRDITIHDDLYQEIRNYIDGIYIDDDERIFYFQKSGLYAEFSRLTTKAELPRIRIHDLRHSHVSMLIDMGVSLPVIAARLGHESPRITLQIYSHMLPDGAKNVSEKFNDLLSEKE